MTSAITVEVQCLPHTEGLPLPAYQSRACCRSRPAGGGSRESAADDAARQRALVPTGLMIAVPPGHEAQVRPRSGLAFKHGVTVLNSPGTVDADYRGEVSVLLINHGDEPFTIRRGERIAQLVIAAVTQANLVVVASLSSTDRGSGGFGSTGR